MQNNQNMTGWQWHCTL